MGFLRRAFGSAGKDRFDKEWEGSAAGPPQPSAGPRQSDWSRTEVDADPQMAAAEVLAQFEVRIEVSGDSHNRYRPAAAADLELATQEAGEPLVEIRVVGESYRQDALCSVAGPKEVQAKQTLVGAVLRCEPTNEHDRDAVRVEVMGQVLGYVAREPAALLSAAIQRCCGGALEVKGLIVGGWVDDYSEGQYGVRVWLTLGDTTRLGVAPRDLDPALRRSRARWPALPAARAGELRLGPTKADVKAGREISLVTVTCEEHYQPAIVAAMPAGSGSDPWPVLVEVVMADCNPHSKDTKPCAEVRIGGGRVGFLTPVMSERHRHAFEAARAAGSRVTAAARASRGVKAGAELWRLKIDLE